MWLLALCLPAVLMVMLAALERYERLLDREPRLIAPVEVPAAVSDALRPTARLAFTSAASSTGRAADS